MHVKTKYTSRMGTRLAGKIAVITGAARSIGAEIARVFVSEGAAVVMADVLGDEAEDRGQIFFRNLQVFLALDLALGLPVMLELLRG